MVVLCGGGSGIQNAIKAIMRKTSREKSSSYNINMKYEPRNIIVDNLFSLAIL